MGRNHPDVSVLLAELASLRQRVVELEALVSDRQQAELALQEQQRFLQLVLDNIPQQIFWKDVNLCYQGCNRNFAVALGLESAQDIIGQTVGSLAPSGELGDVYQQQDREILQSGMPLLRHLEQKPQAEGRVAWLEVSKVPMYDGAGNVVGILGTITDVTEQKQAEIALEKSEVRNQALLDAIPDLIIRMHRDGTYLDFRPAKTFTNIQPHGGTTGKNIYEIMPAAIAQQRLDYAELALSTGLPQSYEFEIEIDGERRTEEARIVACGEDEVVVMLRDVTERARVETSLLQLNEDLEERVHQRTTELHQVNTQLRKSEASLKAAQELAQIGNWEFDLTTQQISWSQEVFHIHGWDLDQPPPSFEQLQWLYHPEDRQQVVALVERAIIWGEPYELDLRIIRPSGEVRYVAAKGRVSCQAGNGQITHLFGTILDITDRKQTEERLKASLAEKNVLLKEVHHRVKNNLQTISSLLKLQAASLSDPRLREPLRDSQNRVRAMAMVHERLYQSASLARVNFAEYIHKLTMELLRAYGGREHLTLQIDVVAGELDVDTAIPCGLIVNELVANAVKYAFPERRSGTIHLSFAEQGTTHYCLLVQDDGVGMPLGFDFRTSPSLGLQLVCLLTQQLQGEIEQLGGPGTTFRIIFPRS